MVSQTCSTRSLVIVTRSAPSFALTCAGSQAAADTVRSANGQDPRVLHLGRYSQQSHTPIDLAPVARRHQHDFLPFLVPLREVHPVVAAERLREEYRGQADIDQLADHRRIAAVAGQVHDEQSVGILDLFRDRGHVGRWDQVSAQELHVAELLLELA